MNFEQIQELLLSLLPMWNYRIAKPFKLLLDEGISLEMYYCIKTLQWYAEPITMSNLARYTKSSKQQMTQTVNRLVEQGLAKRIYDPSNRRIIKIEASEKAFEYTGHFIECNASCFRPFLEQLSPENLADFQKGIELIFNALASLPCDCGSAENGGKAVDPQKGALAAAATG